MRSFVLCHKKAMRSWWKGALAQRRLLSRVVPGEKGWPGQPRPSRKSQEPIIFSGIQPTGIPHLGNYLGALRPWVELQNGKKDCHRCLFCVVDLHALTLPRNADRLAQWRKESFASLLAVGLDPDRSIIFMQSDVSLPCTSLERR
jgi:hypothetical protein